MAIKNYTTTINVNKTIGEIQEYSNGNVTGLSFKIMTSRGEVGIRLPSNTDRVLQVLKNQRKNNNQVKDTFDQANKVAWRIIKDWIDAQMAILETEMVEMEQIFLPYVMNNKGQTLYEAFKKNRILLEDSND